MAESTSPKGNSGDFAKKVQRQLSRSKEKVTDLVVSKSFSNHEIIKICASAKITTFLQVLQRLGKTVESRDDHFEQCLQRFNDQQVIILLLIDLILTIDLLRFVYCVTLKQIEKPEQMNNNNKNTLQMIPFAVLKL